MDQVAQIIDQDSKSLLLAGDEETLNAVSVKINKLVAEYGDKIAR